MRNCNSLIKNQDLKIDFWFDFFDLSNLLFLCFFFKCVDDYNLSSSNVL